MEKQVFVTIVFH